jgi:hypothetical protein
MDQAVKLGCQGGESEKYLAMYERFLMGAKLNAPI